MKRSLQQALTGPETRTWVRAADALITLGAGVGIAICYFLLRASFDATLLHSAFIGAFLSLPLVALTLYRASEISRPERIAILVLVFAVTSALLVAVVEASRDGGA